MVTVPFCAHNHTTFESCLLCSMIGLIQTNPSSFHDNYGYYVGENHYQIIVNLYIDLI